MFPVNDPLAGLHDIRLPDSGWPELCAALALGLILAIILGHLLRLIAWRPPTQRQLLLTELADLRGKEPGERLLGLAHLARRAGIPEVPGLRAALYEPRPALSPEVWNARSKP